MGIDCLRTIPGSEAAIVAIVTSVEYRPQRSEFDQNPPASMRFRDATVEDRAPAWSMQTPLDRARFVPGRDVNVRGLLRRAAKTSVNRGAVARKVWL
jgi:hypothetical protein